jgi:hypothetical protein
VPRHRTPRRFAHRGQKLRLSFVWVRESRMGYCRLILCVELCSPRSLWHSAIEPALQQFRRRGFGGHVHLSESKFLPIISGTGAITSKFQIR